MSDPSDAYTYHGNHLNNTKTVIFSDDLNDAVRMSAGESPAGIQRVVENRVNNRQGNFIGNNNGDGTDLECTNGGGVQLNITKGIVYTRGCRCILQDNTSINLSSGDGYYTIYTECPITFQYPGANPPYYISSDDIKASYNASTYPTITSEYTTLLAFVYVTGSSINTINDLRIQYSTGEGTSQKIRLNNLEFLTGSIGKMVIPDFITYGYTEAAITNAINSLPASGGHLFIPEGTWIFTSDPYVITKNLTIEGTGHTTVLDMGTGNLDIQANYCYIKNLQITNYADIHIDSCNYVIMNNIKTTYGILVGITIDDNFNTVINSIVDKITIDSLSGNLEGTMIYYNKDLWAIVSDGAGTVGLNMIYGNKLESKDNLGTIYPPIIQITNDINIHNIIAYNVLEGEQVDFSNDTIGITISSEWTGTGSGSLADMNVIIGNIVTNITNIGAGTGYGIKTFSDYNTVVGNVVNGCDTAYQDVRTNNADDSSNQKNYPTMT